MFKTFNKLPLLVRVIIAICCGIGIGLIAPDGVVRAGNTFCGIFSEFLGFLIPFIIVGLVTPAIADLGRGAGRMLLLTAAFAYVFTVCSGVFAYFSADTLFPSLIDAQAVSALQTEGRTFAPFFSVEIPPMMNVMTSLIMSFMLGLGIAAFEAPALKRGFDEFKEIISSTIAVVIIPLLPLFIFGLFMDIAASGKIGPILAAFVQIIVVIFILTFILLLLQYTVAGLVTRRNPLKLLGCMLPAYFTALGTSSSAATIPVTLRQAIKNGVSEEVGGFVIPLCATVHLSGSTLKITTCAIALMLIQGIPYDFGMMFGFILMLGITMVAAPGVPGGAIMAALGILGSILGFSAEQQAMMITLYIAMDSFGTACNVTGDGAIALIIDKIAKRQG